MLHKSKTYNYSQMPNGIRMVHKYTDSPVAHLGITIDAGSRDEKKEENGMAHFIEHCIFKGTKTKPYSKILSAIDGVGGELNAYTTKEETVVYATFLTKYYDRAAELLCDIVFNSIFPEKELEKEKSVVKDEINSYKDSPGELIYDDFDTLLFGQTGLGRMILGTEKRVESFTRGMVMDFIARNWFTDRMVISTVGNIDFDKFVRLVEKYFLHIPAHFKDKNRRLVYHYRPKHVSKYKKTHQAHVMIGNVCYSYDSIRRASFSLLNNMLGSNAMNSALNMHIREKYGNTYAIESSYTAYCDTGSFCVYAGCEEHFTEKLIELIYKELKRFTDMPPSPLYLKRSKEQLKGQLAIQYDSNQNEMLSMGKLLLNFGDVADLQESFDEIDRLRADQICDTANEIFIPENMSCLIYH